MPKRNHKLLLLFITATCCFMGVVGCAARKTNHSLPIVASELASTLQCSDNADATKGPVGAGGHIFTGKPISLNYSEVPLSKVLWELAEFAHLQFVSDVNLKNDVSVRLNNVPWDQALNTILHALRLDYEEEGNVIRIATVDQLRAEREKRRLAPRICDPVEGNEFRQIKLSHSLVKSVLPIVMRYYEQRCDCNCGGIMGRDDSNQLVVKSTLPWFEEIRAVVRALDVPASGVK